MVRSDLGRRATFLCLFWLVHNQAFALAPNSCRLRARQSESFDASTISVECQTRCAAIVNTINTCTTTVCTCTTNNQYNLVNCLNCIVSRAPGVIDVINQAQDSVDELENSCRAAGRPLPHRTITDFGAVTTSSSESVAEPTMSSVPPPPPSTINTPSNPVLSSNSTIPSPVITTPGITSSVISITSSQSEVSSTSSLELTVIASSRGSPVATDIAASNGGNLRFGYSRAGDTLTLVWGLAGALMVW